MSRFPHISFLTFFFLGFWQMVLAAEKTVDVEKYRRDYPHDDAIVLKQYREVFINVNEAGPSIVEENYTERLMLTDNFKSYISDRVVYSGMVELIEIKAYTLVPDGKKYRKEPVTDFRVVHNQDASIFFDDEVEQRFVYPSLQPGAKTIVHYKLRYREPRLFGVYFYQDVDPVLSNRFIIHTPPDMTIGYRSLGPGSESLKPQIDMEEAGRRWSWTKENLPGITSESDISGMRQYMIHTKAWIASYKDLKGEQLPYLSSLDDLYRWYVKLVNSADLKASAEMRTLADSLTRGLTSDTARLKAVYYWVQDHIRYVAFEEGYMGIIPHNPADVFKKRYGDCKDKSLLLKTLLGLAGLDARLTWIGTRALPYRFTELPCSGSADHMIVTWYDTAGKPWFLDATNTFLSWKLPAVGIQDKEALVENGRESYRIDTVTLIPSSMSYSFDSLSVFIQGDHLKGSGVLCTEGFVKNHLVDRVKDQDPEKRKRFFSSFIEKGNDKCRLDTAIFSPDFDRDAPYSVRYGVTIADYLHTNGDEMYVNLHLEKPLQNGAIQVKSKQFDVEYLYKYRIRNVFVLTIPEGYYAAFIPPASSGGNEYVSYKFDYSAIPGQVILTQTLWLNTFVLPTKAFQAYNKVITGINKAYNQSLILKKKN